MVSCEIADWITARRSRTFGWLKASRCSTVYTPPLPRLYAEPCASVGLNGETILLPEPEHMPSAARQIGSATPWPSSISAIMFWWCRPLTVCATSWLTCFGGEKSSTYQSGRARQSTLFSDHSPGMPKPRETARRRCISSSR